ncbi:MAG TPA: biopolymer transporter ExbD [Bacteroidetes bacterium]|jgi:biopolymer transport protein ExbD|nr:biopolymer transporter ExbD [Bacteroidota bacterium]
MSGGGGGGAEPRSHGKKKRKKGRRLGIRIDMTPLVDVAFLLLTFFMLTTSMVRPQTMEINLPPEDVKVEIGESNLLNLWVDETGKIYWAMGLESAKKIEFADLRSFLREKGANPKLTVLVKIDRKGKYSSMVDIMDELNLTNLTRFSLAPMLEKDKTLLAKVQNNAATK